MGLGLKNLCRHVCEPIVHDCYSSKLLLFHRRTVLYPINLLPCIITIGVHGIQLGVSLYPTARTTSRFFILVHGDYLVNPFAFYPVSYLNPIVHFGVHHTAHLCVGSASAERVGWVHLLGAIHMAAAWLGWKMAMVDTGWANPHPGCMNGVRKCYSYLVGSS